VKIDISKGRYWDEGITLVESCTPCSPGCDHCWALAMERRFKPEFKNQIKTHPERLKRFNTRKPKVFSIWNDLYHVSVPDSFQCEAYKKMILNKQNTYLILTKRPAVMAKFLSPETCFSKPDFPHIWHGLTVCNQQEADEKIPVFLKVPGRLFLSIEPMLGPINLDETCGSSWCWRDGAIQSVILGGETGAGARPMNPDWVRSVRDQCAAAGVPFFFKSWGAWKGSKDFIGGKSVPGSERIGRLLDGKTYDSLPWVKP
jgi:protein gp37